MPKQKEPKPIKLKDIVKGSSLGDLMDDYWEASDDTRSEKHIHPSSISSLCVREYYHILMGDIPRGNPDMNMKKLLSRAKIVHEEIQRVWWDMGILVGDWLCHQCGKIWEDRSPKRCPDCESKYLEFMEVPLEKPEWNMRGRGDGILVIAAKLGLGEIKSINPYDFNVLTEPKQAHIFQCHCYMEMYKEPLNEAWIHYNERTNGRYKNFKIEKDPAVVEILDHNIKVLSECLEKKEPPELNYNEKVLYCNKRCMARKICKGE